MYRICTHYEGSRRFLEVMDLPPPNRVRRSNVLKARIQNAIKTVAKHNMQFSTTDIKAFKGEDVSDLCDGTWQRRFALRMAYLLQRPCPHQLK